MKVCDGFEVVNIADEYLAVPIGDKTKSFQGIVILNEAAALLLDTMKQTVSEDELVIKLKAHYDVEDDVASRDVREMLVKLTELGLISD